MAEELPGRSVAALLDDPRLPVRIAALDAYFGALYPHARASEATTLMLPYGAPPERARARDDAIASLLTIRPGQRVGLIGVVNPLVARSSARQVLPALRLQHRAHAQRSAREGHDAVLERAEMIIATGMTLGNGSFDRILSAAIAEQSRWSSLRRPAARSCRVFGHGVTAISAKSFLLAVQRGARPIISIARPRQAPPHADVQTVGVLGRRLRSCATAGAPRSPLHVPDGPGLHRGHSARRRTSSTRQEWPRLRLDWRWRCGN